MGKVSEMMIDDGKSSLYSFIHIVVFMYESLDTHNVSVCV